MSQLAKTFFDPEGMIVHQRQIDRDKLRSTAEARIATPKGEEDGTSPAPSVKYYPLSPEQWKKRAGSQMGRTMERQRARYDTP